MHVLIFRYKVECCRRVVWGLSFCCSSD